MFNSTRTTLGAPVVKLLHVYYMDFKVAKNNPILGPLVLMSEE